MLPRVKHYLHKFIKVHLAPEWNFFGQVTLIDEENDLMLLRNAVEAMMAPLGYHGEISARDDRVQSVMDALAYLDTTPARQTSA